MVAAGAVYFLANNVVIAGILTGQRRRTAGHQRPRDRRR